MYLKYCCLYLKVFVNILVHLNEYILKRSNLSANTEGSYLCSNWLCQALRKALRIQTLYDNVHSLKEFSLVGTPLQYSCLENPMDRGPWWAAVRGVVKSWTRLSDFPFTFHFHVLEKEMATHSSVLAWRIPGTAEPGGLLSVGLHRVGHDWSDLVEVVGKKDS